MFQHFPGDAGSFVDAVVVFSLVVVVVAVSITIGARGTMSVRPFLLLAGLFDFLFSGTLGTTWKL